MSAARLVLRRQLLGMTSCGPDIRHPPNLGDREWDKLSRMARQHRLGPLLYWRFTNADNIPQVPGAVLGALAETFRKQTMRALLLQAQIARLHCILEDRGIRAVFLKGAYLAFHAYPNAALRPMRDLDILVPKHAALDAFDALLHAGFVRHRLSPGSPLAALECAKHLPSLVSPLGRVSVELHTRLTDPESDRERPRLDPADRPETWDRLIHGDVAGERIAYLAPTDQLLHLIIHAVYDHQLNCGPLVLTDIAELIRSTAIEWPLFWELAAAGRWIPGCRMMLHVTRCFYALAISEPADFAALPPLPADVVDTAATLMLGDLAERGNVRLRAELLVANSLAARAAILVGRIRRSRTWIAANHTTNDASGAPHGSYLAHCWRLSSVRLPQYVAGLLKPDTHDSRYSAKLQHWLRD
jgi:Uncharacterised nucleotidyltransferase